MSYRRIELAGLIALIAIFPALPAEAHITTGMGGGLTSGFLHPLTGLDHFLAMVSVGIWGAQLGEPAIWVLPIAFPMIMAFGGALGIVGVPLPATELLIALSVLILGTMIALAQRLPLFIAMAIVGVFAIAHGHAHGVELPHAANALGFSVGFVIATGLLHALGILIGLLTRFSIGSWAVRISGAGIAMVGIFFVYSYAKA